MVSLDEPIVYFIIAHVTFVHNLWVLNLNLMLWLRFLRLRILRLRLLSNPFNIFENFGLDEQWPCAVTLTFILRQQWCGYIHYNPTLILICQIL